MTEEVQKRFQKELDKFKGVEKEIQKAVSQRKLLDSQLSENKCVREELSLCGEGAVYKLIGPVLVKQGLDEAKQNVGKRIDYIGAELKRIDSSITGLQQKQEEASAALAKLEKDFQQAQLKAALKR